MNGLNLLPDAEIALQLPKRVNPILSFYNGNPLTFFPVFPLKKQTVFPTMYLLVVRTLIVLDVYIVKFEQKNYSFKKKDSSLTGFKINPILLEN